MIKIAIRGHQTRGKEIIQILKSLGGKTREELTGRRLSQYYFINCNGDIDLNLRINLLNHKLYTLEEFEKEFPFKVGDKVTIAGLPDFPKIITQMAWDRDAILYSFEDSNNTWFHADALKKFEMKKERNVTLTLDKAKEWYKKGGELKEIALQAFSEKELNTLPRSWEEFCENYPIKPEEICINGYSKFIVSNVGDRNSTHDKNICPSRKSAEAHLAMIQLEQLRDCWLDGWKPKWDISEKWCIRLYKNELHVGLCTDISRFLTFPTREMAEEFLKCFRDLIESCKDLL